MLTNNRPTTNPIRTTINNETEAKAKKDAVAAAAAEEELRRQLQRDTIATPGRAPPRRMTTPRRPVGL